MIINKNNIYAVEYRLIKHETLHGNFTRLVYALNNFALSLCKYNTIRDSEKVIHEIRKCMKRTRAVLKLFRSAAGEELYHKQNSIYREINQKLAPLRLSAVNVNTLNVLISDGRMKVNLQYNTSLADRLKTRHNELLREMILKQKIYRTISRTLRNNKKSIILIPESDHEYQVLLSGLYRMYKRCQVNLFHAMSHPTGENIHNLRKPVKYLWYQMMLIRPVWSPTIGQIIHNLDLLGERLGNEHDLAELEQFLWSNYFADADNIEPVVHLIRKDRIRIQRHVWPLAQKVFAETPGAFIKRMKTYFNVSGFLKDS